MFLESLAVPSQVFRGRIHGTAADGSALTLVEGISTGPILCDVLENGHGQALAPGDGVLVLLPTTQGERGVVLGRIRPGGETDEVSEAPSSSGPPDTIVLEARNSLTIRVGEGSIEIRADGKILIKGKDLVSHAQRTNRIKGGSVAIN